MKTYKAELWERDSWSGPELLETRTFDTEVERDAWIRSVNSKNTAKQVPEYYIHAIVA